MSSYTYWIFYLMKDIVDVSAFPFDLETDIYAYTDSKEIAERFKNTRNMKYFACRKMKLDKSEVHDLTKDLNNAYLQNLEGHCPILGMGTKEITYNIPITKLEKIVIDTDCYNVISSHIYTYAFNSPFIFKEEYVEALGILKYIDCYRYVKNGGTALECRPNLLNVFLKQFGFMLKL